MSIATVVTEGYGSFGSIAFVVTEGYGAYGVTPPPPVITVDPNISGGGPPKKRRTLHLEGYRPTIVDPREYQRTVKVPVEAKEPQREAPAAPWPDRGQVDDLPSIARMPDDLAQRLETSITAAERKRAMAELAADDEAALMAIIRAIAQQ